jgi:protocadherin Fat 1/2/3
MARVIYFIWSLLILDEVHGFYGNNFGVRESPLSLFEMQGARQVNKFTRGGLYRTTFSKYSVINSYVKSPLKMGFYVDGDTNAVLEYAVSAGAQQTRRSGVNCSGTNSFDVEGELYGNFYAMRIKTKRLLSEEQCESYLLNVEAKIDKRTVDTTHVFIEARMSTNFDPWLNKTRILKTIPKNFPLFQQIMQLKTKDEQDWGKVYFSLQQESAYFVLNPINGILFLKQSLPSGISRFNLVAAVTKWDKRRNMQVFTEVNTCKITIKVMNVNQYAPTMAIKISDKTQNNGGKQAIAIITVNDLDQGKNGRIDDLTIMSGNEEGNFGVERVNGPIFKLYLIKSLDCHHCWFQITFKATDRGDPPLSTTKVHRFSLKYPLLKNNSFVASEHFVEISEMTPIGYIIIDLKPQILPIKSNMSCTIIEGNTFTVPKDTCKIKLSAPLDAMVRSSYVLKVSYKISGDIVVSGSTIVNVHVVDFNNFGPVFVSKNHYVEISEDLAVNVDVYKVEVKDGDVGENGKLTYWLMSESSQFKIDPNTGMISVKQLSDRDAGTPEFAYLVVRVADNGSPFRREAETIVTIRIRASNDNVPVIKQGICQIKLPPGSSVGTKLVKIEAIDIDVDSNTKISFSIMSGNTNSMFAIDSSSGSVTLANRLSSRPTSFTLVVSAYDGTKHSQNNAILKISIEGQHAFSNCTVSSMYVRTLKMGQTGVSKTPVKPVLTTKALMNAYAPTFSTNVLTITVSEDVKVGTVLTKLKAVDNDNGYEGLLTYYIVDGKQNHCFGIDALTGELRLVAALDWENVAKYELNVSAWDSGVPRKVGFGKVRIVVEDVNDNPPKFSQDFYNVSVSENSPPGKVVRLISSDNLVSKGFTFKLVNDYNQLFSVNSGSKGLNLVTNKQLDFEEQKLYEIQVLALDGSFGNQPNTQAYIIVNVEDVNDNHPVVYHSNQHVIIMRDLPVGSPITKITASDADSGIYGEVNFAMVTSFGSELFSIDSNTGLIKLSKPLTGKTDDSYNLSIAVSDGGEPSLRTKTYVSILVIQRTSGVKVIGGKSGISQYVVNENRPAGEKIAELGGSEIPASKRNNYAFSIIDGTDVTMFNATDKSGWLTTTASLDREQVPYYWLTVLISKKKSKQVHSIMQILIKVEDDNDNGPIFYPPVYESKIPENTNEGEFVIAVTANDADSGENGNLTYAIIQGNEEGHFQIDAATGIITTTDIQLDFESQRMIRLQVSATDGGKYRKTSQATVTIYVQDENDNYPNFHRNPTVHYSVSDTSDLPANTLLGQVYAHDKDDGKNGALTFRIKSGNTGEKLRIDAKSGQLYNNAPLDDLDAFQLQIEAKDGGQPALASTTFVNVIGQVPRLSGKNPPVFPQKVEEISLSENTPVGHKIDITPAVDKDMYDTLSYFIYTGNEEQKFRIKSFQSSLEVIAELEPPSYQLIIVASDGLNSDNLTLNININDINDHYPIPQMTEKIATLPESARPGTTKVTEVSGKCFPTVRLLRIHSVCKTIPNVSVWFCGGRSFAIFRRDFSILPTYNQTNKLALKIT